MSKKILITGNGYICRGLCEILKKAENNGDITVIDNILHKDRVNWLLENGIEFYQRDLFDVKDLVRDSEIIYHTAGMTAVPQKIEDSNPEIDAQIHKIGTEGTRYLIENVNKNAKFVFLSTHVIFEGYTNKFDIDETVTPRPILAYPRSKEQNEIDLQKSNVNYVIARLASVYGYNPSIRWPIVANIFSKLTAEKGKIRVFGGNAYKPLVSVNDCARALVMLAERNYNKEIFHIVNENTQVKTIAAICKKYRPDLQIEEVVDNSENSGYTCSNKKLLSTGFRFYEHLEKEMEKMIKIYSK